MPARQLIKTGADAGRFERTDACRFELTDAGRFDLTDACRFEPANACRFELADACRFEPTDAGRFELADARRFPCPERSIRLRLRAFATFVSLIPHSDQELTVTRAAAISGISSS